VVFNNLSLLLGASLDRGNMKEKTLYLFKSNGSRIAAWLENNDIKLKVLDKKGK